MCIAWCLQRKHIYDCIMRYDNFITLTLIIMYILQKHFQTITWTIYVHTYLLMIDQPTYLFSLWFLPPGPKYVSKSSFFLRLDVWSSNVLVNARVSTSYMASRTCTFTISIKQRKLGQAMQRSVCWGDVISRAALPIFFSSWKEKVTSWSELKILLLQ